MRQRIISWLLAFCFSLPVSVVATGADCSAPNANVDEIVYRLSVLLSSQKTLGCSRDLIQAELDLALATANMNDPILNDAIISFSSLDCSRRRLLEDSYTPRELGIFDDLIQLLSDIYQEYFLPNSGICNFCWFDENDRRLRGNSTKGMESRSRYKKRSVAPISRNLGACVSGNTLLDFSTYANGLPITGTPYLKTSEYKDSHGITIRAFLKNNNGYAPSRKVRIFDTSNPGTNNYNGDPDLGSPNNYCSPPGPGKGNGGKPTKNGQTNPGANCVPQGNVIIIQESNKQYADDNAKGGRIRFDFDPPVNMQRITLMDVDENESGDLIKVWSRWQERDLDGNVIVEEVQTFVFKIEGYGDNSIDGYRLERRGVTRLDVSFPGSGAISSIEYNRDCDLESETVRIAAVESAYSQAQLDTTVSEFAHLIAPLRQKLNEILTAAIGYLPCMSGNPFTVQTFLVPSTLSLECSFS